MKTTTGLLAAPLPPPQQRQARWRRAARRAWWTRVLSVLALVALALLAPGPAAAGAKDRDLPLAGDARGAAKSDGGPVLQRNGGLRCRSAAGAPTHLLLQPGKSVMLPAAEPVAGRSIGNPGVAQAVLVAPDTLYVAGVAIGSTNMVVQLASGMCRLVEIEVALDAAGLQAALAALLPQEKDVRVMAASDSLVLSGTVTDGPTLMQVQDLALAYVRRPAPRLAMPAATGTPPAGQADSAQSPRVVNLLSVTAPQQVMLEVKIAEVSKTLLDKLEIGVLMTTTSGSWTASLLSNFITGVARGSAEFTKGVGKSLRIDAERQDNLVRILAEPTLIAVSGQEGSFLAGGKILIPVAQDDRRITLEEKEFGVGLRFTPTVLAGGRINLKVAPEVSELSREGVGIRATGFGGPTVLPLVTTRRAATTVQLNDGQSFVIGGLIRNNQNTDVKALPLLGEIPVLGALFRSTDFLHERTELLFVITARLVQPQAPGQPLPTGDMAPPGRASLMLGARPAGGQP